VRLAKAQKCRTVKMPVSAPFHCRLMEPAKQELERAFAEVYWHDANVPVYMNVDGFAHTEAADIRECVLRQTVSPVRWSDTMQNMQRDLNCRFVELGVGDTLCGLAEKNLPEVCALPVENAATLAAALDILTDK